MRNYRLKVSRDALRVSCPAVRRDVPTKSCTRGPGDTCACFQGVDWSGSQLYIKCDYGLEYAQKSVTIHRA